MQMAIERWRTVSGKHVREWIGGVGEFEALFALAATASSISGCFPELAHVDGGCLTL